jgi:hypothetical protein
MFLEVYWLMYHSPIRIGHITCETTCASLSSLGWGATFPLAFSWSEIRQTGQSQDNVAL